MNKLFGKAIARLDGTTRQLRQAQDVNTPDSTLLGLVRASADDRKAEVLLAIARNGNSSSKTLDAASDAAMMTGQYGILKELINHKNISAGTLDKMHSRMRDISTELFDSRDQLSFIEQISELGSMIEERRDELEKRNKALVARHANMVEQMRLRT